MIAETKLTEKPTEDEKGTDLLLPRMLVKKPLEVDHRKLHIVYAGTEAHGHIGNCLGYALLTLHGKATKPRKDEFRERVGTIIERTLTGEARVDTYKDRLAERERERGGGDVHMEPGNRDDEQVAVRHADASGGYIFENQHEEDRTRDIHVGERGSEAASEEQSDKWRKTERLEHEAPNTSASSDPNVALEYLASGETHSRPGSAPVQKSGHVNDDVQNFCVGCILRDGWTKESLHQRSVGCVSRTRCRRSQEK